MPQHEHFGEWLADEIERAGISKRQLAFRVAKATTVDPESARRLLHKHLNGEPASLALRTAYAEALGLRADFFGSARRRRLERLLADMNDLLNHNREMERVA